MTRSPRRIAAIAVLSLLLVLALRVALYRPLAVTGEAPQDGFVRVPGVVHVHTTLSDGGGSPEEVIGAARAAGLRFVVVTDHNNLDAKPFEGYRDGVLVIVGTELSTTAGHLLGLGVDNPPYRFSGDALDGLHDIRELGGFSFAAHPLSPREDLRFSGWDLPGPWGIELVNGDSEWRRAGPRILLTAALYGLNHRYALLRGMNPADAMLARWDELLALRDVAGIAGADAHSRIPLTRKRALRFPSYESLFSLQRNHLLLRSTLKGEVDEDRRTVLEALRRGALYIGLDALAPADEVSFVAEGAGQRFTMGDTAPPQAGLRLVASGRWPEGARGLVLRDGKRFAEGPGPLTAEVEGPGVYRLEVHVPGARVPWVITNPIYVFDEAERAERERRAAWPPPEESPPVVETLDAFEEATFFAAAADTRSSARTDVMDPRAGRDGKGAARLQFRIGEVAPDHPDVFAALVDRTHRDLSGRKGLVLSVRADGEYRIWVQVRDENGASLDEGTEWWFASIKTSTEWQRVALPFARFRSINPRTDGRLDLDKVRALVFVLDKGSVRPGARGTIWLDDLGLY